MTPPLITPAEVWELAFPGADYVLPETLSPLQVEIVQEQYLRPVFGALYETLGEERHETFVVEYLKAPLAYYVRSLVLSEMAASIGSLGVVQGRSDYASPLPPRQVHTLRKQARHRADRLLQRAVEHVEAHAGLFPEYDPGENARHHTSILGGIVLEKGRA